MYVYLYIYLKQVYRFLFAEDLLKKSSYSDTLSSTELETLVKVFALLFLTNQKAFIRAIEKKR